MTSLRLNYLDVLKAIAIIAVVLYHAGVLRYGYLGGKHPINDVY